MRFRCLIVRSASRWHSSLGRFWPDKTDAPLSVLEEKMSLGLRMEALSCLTWKASSWAEVSPRSAQSPQTSERT